MRQLRLILYSKAASEIAVQCLTTAGNGTRTENKAAKKKKKKKKRKKEEKKDNLKRKKKKKRLNERTKERQL